MEHEVSLPHLQKHKPVHILNQINPVQGDIEIYAEIFWSSNSVLLKITSLILKLIKPDPEIYSCWYWIIYREILMFLQTDTEILQGDT